MLLDTPVPDIATALAPDLVLMDIQLAGEMDGVAAAQIIRQRFARPVVISPLDVVCRFEQF